MHAIVKITRLCNLCCYPYNCIFSGPYRYAHGALPLSGSTINMSGYSISKAVIQYKLLLLVHKAFIGGSPPYLADMMITRNTTRSTRSSHRVNLLGVPHHGVNKYSEKAFAVAGPRLWNELLTDELRGCSSLDTFKKKLKTLLFQKHY